LKLEEKKDDEKVIATQQIDDLSTNRFWLLLALFCVAGVIVPLLYTLYTHHIWEDFFITFRCSKNLVEGNGLVYQVGEKVHAFTSPLGVLLPALSHWAMGAQGYSSALWLFRILFCIPAFVLGGVFVMKSFREFSGQSKKTIPIVLVSLFYLLDVKAVMFSMNGMETALMLFFLAVSVYLMFRGISENWLWTGVAWGGLMWTRPDSCVYIAILMLTTIIFGSSPERRFRIVAILKAAIVTTILYLPWFLWAWWYYGSPIPNTVLAKSAMMPFSIERVLTSWTAHAAWAFAPAYPTFSVWPPTVPLFSYAMAAFSLIYWMLPSNDKFGKPLSFIFFSLSFYFAFMPYPYPWYYPPFALTGSMVIVSGIWNLLAKVRKGVVVATILNLIILLNIGMIFVLSTRQMKLQQSIIETTIRRNVGLWLKENIKPDETVYLECLGYIGYFSERKMLDYPGLATPKSVDLMKKHHLDFGGLLLALQPDWAVLRPLEAKALMKKRKFCKQYAYVAHFSAVKLLEKAGYIPGIGYLQHDAVFIIFKRKKAFPAKKAPLRG
jgi:hypothetical protein